MTSGVVLFKAGLTSELGWYPRGPVQWRNKKKNPGQRFCHTSGTCSSPESS